MSGPNIVYVLADQHRLPAMGFWRKPEYRHTVSWTGDPVHTPHIDGFADESIVFTRAVSNCPLCSPYRGMLFSGRFPMKNGVRMNCKAGRDSGLREDVFCLTDVLAEGGYDVGYIGKYHLDKPEPHFDGSGRYVGAGGGFYADGSRPGDESCWDMATPTGPKRHGVNFWYAYGTFDEHHNPHYWDNNCDRHEPGVWSPEHEADIATGYILNNAGQRDANKPFCLFVSMNPPHSPYDSAADTDEGIFERCYSRDVVGDARELLARDNAEPERFDKERARFYFSHVTGVDRQFGRILRAIEASGQGENTIVVYSSDHGDMMGSHGLLGKNEPYDECLLIPLLIRYPRKILHHVEDLMIGGTDIMPTLLGLAGLGGSIPGDVDGTDYSRLLTGEGSPLPQKPQSALYIHDYDDYQRKGVRAERYTLVIERRMAVGFKKYVLFDNLNDPYQMNNLELCDIPEGDLAFLLNELDCWLEKAGDLWSCPWCENTRSKCLEPGT